jgi:hypothetical protein
VAVDQQVTVVEGLATSYLVAGEGTPLLLLHALERERLRLAVGDA